MTEPRAAVRTPIPRAALATAAVVCASVVVSHIFGRNTYSVLLSAISEDLVSSFTAAGFLGASNFAGYMAGVILVTVVSDRVEPIWLLRGGLALGAIALVLLAVAPNFGVLTAGVGLIGFGGAGIWITAPAIATAGVPADRRGAVLGALTATMGFGLLLVSQGTTLYRNVVGDESAWRPIFGIEAGVTALILVAAVVLVRPAATATQRGRGSVFSAEALTSIPHWVLLTVGYTAFSTLAGAWVQFMGVALEDEAGFSRGHINNLFSVLAVAGIVGPLAMGRLSDRFGRSPTMACSAAMTAVASLLLIVGAEPWTTASAAFFGAGSFAVPVLTAAAVRDHLDDRAFGTAFGSMTILYGAGSLIAAQLSGVLADVTGSFAIVYVLLACAATVTIGCALVRSSRLRAAGHRS